MNLEPLFDLVKIFHGDAPQKPHVTVANLEGFALVWSDCHSQVEGLTCGMNNPNRAPIQEIHEDEEAF